MASKGFKMNLFNKKHEVFNITNILSKIDDHIKLLDGKIKNLKLLKPESEFVLLQVNIK